MALQSTIKSAGPLISAIEAHQRKTGTLPANLSKLIPNYLAKLPDPGPAAKGGWLYEVDPSAKKWSLRIDVRDELSPNMWMGFGDTFEYRPDGRYPDKAYGGILEPFGSWAYYVE